jgi:hypothetical protein
MNSTSPKGASCSYEHGMGGSRDSYANLAGHFSKGGG